MNSERFDQITVPENLSQRVRKGIREGEKIYMQRKRKKVIVRTAAAAAAVFMSVGVFATQPALASKIPVIGNIFKLLQGDYSYQGDLDAVAQKFDSPQGIGGETETKHDSLPSADSSYTRTVDGVTVSVSEAYCSVEAIYLSLMITSEKDFPDTLIDMEGRPVISLKGETAYSFAPARGGEEEGYAGASGSLEGTFLDSRTYAGIYRIDIVDICGNDDAMKEAYRALREFDMDLTIEQIIGDKANPQPLDLQGKTEADLEAMTDEEWKAFMYEITPEDWYQFPNQYENWWLDGPFTFRLHIEADNENAQVVTVDEMNDTGAGLYQVVKTNFEITVEAKCSEARGQSGIFTVVLDADGKLLPSGSSSYADTYAINGRDTSKIYVYVCDYVEYMDEIKGYRNDEGFQELLEEKALYGKEIMF